MPSKFRVEAARIPDRDRLLEALQHDPEMGTVLPTAIAIYELPDGETAVAASPALAPVASDFGWRDDRPSLAAIADRARERVARALDRLPHVRLQADCGV